MKFWGHPWAPPRDQALAFRFSAKVLSCAGTLRASILCPNGWVQREDLYQILLFFPLDITLITHKTNNERLMEKGLKAFWYSSGNTNSNANETMIEKAMAGTSTFFEWYHTRMRAP